MLPGKSIESLGPRSWSLPTTAPLCLVTPCFRGHGYSRSCQNRRKSPISSNIMKFHETKHLSDYLMFGWGGGVQCNGCLQSIAQPKKTSKTSNALQGKADEGGGKLNPKSQVRSSPSKKMGTQSSPSDSIRCTSLILHVGSLEARVFACPFDTPPLTPSPPPPPKPKAQPRLSRSLCRFRRLSGAWTCRTGAGCSARACRRCCRRGLTG